MATFLHKLVFDLAHVAAKDMVISNLDNCLIHWIKTLLAVAMIHSELRSCICNFDRIRKKISCSFAQVTLRNTLFWVRRLSLHKLALVGCLLLGSTLVQLDDPTIVLMLEMVLHTSAFVTLWVRWSDCRITTFRHHCQILLMMMRMRLINAPVLLNNQACASLTWVTLT